MSGREGDTPSRAGEAEPEERHREAVRDMPGGVIGSAQVERLARWLARFEAELLAAAGASREERAAAYDEQLDQHIRDGSWEAPPAPEPPCHHCSHASVRCCLCLATVPAPETPHEVCSSVASAKAVGVPGRSADEASTQGTPASRSDWDVRAQMEALPAPETPPGPEEWEPKWPEPVVVARYTLTRQPNAESAAGPLDGHSAQCRDFSDVGAVFCVEGCPMAAEQETEAQQIMALVAGMDKIAAREQALRERCEGLADAVPEALRVLGVARDRAVSLGDTVVNLGGADMNRGQFLALVEATETRLSAALSGRGGPSK